MVFKQRMVFQSNKFQFIPIKCRINSIEKLSGNLIRCLFQDMEQLITEYYLIQIQYISSVSITKWTQIKIIKNSGKKLEWNYKYASSTLTIAIQCQKMPPKCIALLVWRSYNEDIGALWTIRVSKAHGHEIPFWCMDKYLKKIPLLLKKQQQVLHQFF